MLYPGKRLPIGGMTVSARQGDRELCFAAKMDDYTSKPIRVEELAAALNRSNARNMGQEVAGAGN